MSKPLNEIEWPGNIPLDKLKSRCSDIKDDLFWRLYGKWRSQTLISPERLYFSYSAVKNCILNNVPGDFVECGVFRGGAFCFFCELIDFLGERDRTLWAYDTFNGFPDGVKESIHDGSEFHRDSWHTCDFEHIFKDNLKRAQNTNRVKVVKGSVLETIPAHIPQEIAFLHLDTDYYEATLHELNHLYHLVDKKGAIMIDDYGHFNGARLAVDQFINTLECKPLILRSDYSGRLIVPR
jgi:O-methyltransferase